MRRLYLVRHAPVVVDFAVPAREWPLAPDAAGGVHDLAERLAAAGLRRIVASPEDKAVATGALLATALGLPLAIREGLEEHHRLVEQQAADRAVFEANVRRFFDRPNHVVFGTESAAGALARFQGAVGALMDETGMDETGADELIVSHGTVITLLTIAGGNGEPMDLWSSLKLPDLITLGWPGLCRIDR